EEGNLTELEREIYSRKLQEHAARFPEKPIAEVRVAFETKEHLEAETPTADSLDRAFGIYEKILVAGQELIKVPPGEVTRRLKLLLDPLESFRKHKEETQKKPKEVSLFILGIKGGLEGPKNPVVAQPIVIDDNFKIQFFALLREVFKREFG